MVSRLISSLLLVIGLAAFTSFSVNAETPKRGGILNFVVGSKIPSYDAHQEVTFGMIHPIRPFYSVLIRVNPENPQDATDFVCDLCVGDVPKPTDGGTKYTFKIRQGVKFHDGTPLTSADVKASLDKVMFPPKGVPSSRKTWFKLVDSVSAPSDDTLVIKLKFASEAFIPALAAPFNFIYSKKDLDTHGYSWHRTNINGTGAFKFVQHQPGAFVEGARYDGFHHEGKPYLDGYKAIAAPKMATRVNAIRGGQAAAEFRSFPPKAVNDLKKALGDKLVVQESNWNCNLMYSPNHKVKPFDDVRVRRALNLAVDRKAASKYLSQIAILKTVGGVIFPGHPLAATDKELSQIEGFWNDIEKSRAKARQLLKEAGVEGLSLTLNNRGVDQPYKIAGTWLIGQWKKIGIKAKQDVKPSGPFFDSLRKKKDFDVSMDFNCQAIVNPLLDITKFLGEAGNNYAQYEDPVLTDLHNKMMREPDFKKLRSLVRSFEKRVFQDEAHMAMTLWWYKINPHHSYMKGWKIAPSHYLNQTLEQVWLDK